MRAYRIVGIFDVGMFEYDSGFVFMPLRGGADLLSACRTR